MKPGCNTTFSFRKKSIKVQNNWNSNTFEHDQFKYSGMKKYILYILTTALLVVIGYNANAQCKSFAKKLCKLELTGYTHDGNYDAAILTEGEEAELYKTFYAGQSYRLAVCGTEALPPIEYQVVDGYKNVLFDSREKNQVRVWDFSLESSQQLKIVVKVPVAANKSEIPNSGCVAIMFGFQNE